MANPRGLVFRIANYDVTDELSRNFAFTSQEINDRTASLIIDYGGVDEDGDGVGDSTKRLRVATSAGHVIDTNGDGVIDRKDRRVTFDLNGKAVGLPLIAAMEEVTGLTYVTEEDKPTSSLSPEELDSTFSTKRINNFDVLWRVRGVSRELTNPLKKWLIFLPNGLDPTVPLSQITLEPGQGITLAFVQDLDDDGLIAQSEFMHQCPDIKTDTDNDLVTDINEVYRGVVVEVSGRRPYRAFSSCNAQDTDLDGLSDRAESQRVVLVQGVTVPAPTDPSLLDTDGDKVSDFDEINGYSIQLRFPEDTNGDGVPDRFNVTVTTNPLVSDTDGDTLIDGDERQFGTNPTVDDGDKVFDDDGDGLRNFEEAIGWQVRYFRASTTVDQQGLQITCTPPSFAACLLAPTSDPRNPDTDGDGLTDSEEKTLGTHPRIIDTDEDSATDSEEIERNGTNLLQKTNPLDGDMDNDTVSDGTEVKVPWVVRVVGEAPREVFSDPKNKDQDLDLLTDNRERTAGTDPNLPDGADTDGDTYSDFREVERGTNPLERDQQVRFTFTSTLVSADCDDGSGGGDFIGLLQFRKNADSPITGFNFFTDRGTNGQLLREVPEGSALPMNASAAFTLKDGDTLQVSSEGLCEEDDTGGPSGDCDSNDEEIPNFSEPYSFVVTPGNRVFQQIRDNGCRLDITLNVQVLN